MELENLGNWSLDAISSAIKANLEAGLKTTTNFNFSLEHLEYIVHAKRAEMIKVLNVTEKKDLIQEINCIPLDCENLSLCCKENTFNTTLHFILPNYISLEYVTIPDRSVNINVYENYNYIYNEYRDSRLTKRPYVSIRNHEGVKHGFLFNPPTDNIKFVSLSVILENPLDVNQYSCCSLDKTNGKYPMPNWMVSRLITEITADWASWMYRFQGQKANNQTSLA